MQRPDRVHFGSDFGFEALTPSRDSGRIGGVGGGVNSHTRLAYRCDTVAFSKA